LALLDGPAGVMFRSIAWAYGHPWHLWAKVIGAVVVTAYGWATGTWMETMVAYTMFLTVTTDLGTIVIQHAGEQDTHEIKAQVSELGRAMPGARDVISESEG
jgi:low affinity Fe/Cu permease